MASRGFVVDRPSPGGIGTGIVLAEVLDESGFSTEGYEWVYGVFTRDKPFEPHEALDGEQFEDFDADVLANPGDWPDTSHFYPGDHDGCACDFAVVLIDNGLTQAAEQIDETLIALEAVDAVTLGDVNLDDLAEILDAEIAAKSKPRRPR